MSGESEGNFKRQQPDTSPILVIDDDLQIRRFLHLALEDQGFAVVPMADGRSAVEWLTQQRPTLLLLDISLPGTGGIAVADHLRARYGPEVPIIVLTADGRAAEKAQRVGAIAYFHKPFDLYQLIATLRDVLPDH
jgi:DNA-binding response OmpR family regulator